METDGGLPTLGAVCPVCARMSSDDQRCAVLRDMLYREIREAKEQREVCHSVYPLGKTVADMGSTPEAHSPFIIARSYLG